jgi:uncharacterized protein
MPLQLNLHHLEKRDLTLEGELPVAELDLEGLDEMIDSPSPLTYEFHAHLAGRSILIQGRLRLPLHCRCVRCLKEFDFMVELLDWTCHLELEGEEKVLVQNDCVDLTGFIREDILLAFPQHPLCDPGCGGLPNPHAFGRNQSGAAETCQTDSGSSVWSELNKLKF